MAAIRKIKVAAAQTVSENGKIDTNLARAERKRRARELSASA